MELLEPDLVALYAAPDEVYNEAERLPKQLCPDHTQMPNESPGARSFEARIYIHAGQSVGHLFAIVIGNYLHIVSLIASLHQLVELLRPVKRVAQRGNQLSLVVMCESQELGRLNL